MISVSAKALDGFLDEILDTPAIVNEPPLDPNVQIGGDTSLDVDVSCPKNNAELQASVGKLVKRIPDSMSSTAFRKLAATVKHTTTEENKMSKEQRFNEAVIRGQIRRIIAEMNPHDASFTDDEAEPAFVRKAYSSTYIGGAEFNQIAKEFGLSIAGAKRAFREALMKAQFLGKMIEDDPTFSERLDEIVLGAIDDYIKKLVSTGEVTSEEEELLRSHADMVTDLDGFREFLESYIKKEMKDTLGEKGWAERYEFEKYGDEADFSKFRRYLDKTIK